jgi:hypothetical protein
LSWENETAFRLEAAKAALWQKKINCGTFRGTVDRDDCQTDTRF